MLLVSIEGTDNSDPLIFLIISPTYILVSEILQIWRDLIFSIMFDPPPPANIILLEYN